jgi:hypothetical protein
MTRSTRYIIMLSFVGDLRQFGSFLLVLRFPPPIKLTTTISQIRLFKIHMWVMGRFTPILGCDWSIDLCLTPTLAVFQLFRVVNFFYIITLLPFFIEMLQYDYLWSGHMIIKEMFYIPIKLKPNLQSLFCICHKLFLKYFNDNQCFISQCYIWRSYYLWWGGDPMSVRLTTTYVISAYHH